MELLISRKTKVCHQTHIWKNIGLLMISLCMYIIFSFFHLGVFSLYRSRDTLSANLQLYTPILRQPWCWQEVNIYVLAQKKSDKTRVLWCTVILNSFPCSPTAWYHNRVKKFSHRSVKVPNHGMLIIIHNHLSTHCAICWEASYCIMANNTIVILPVTGCPKGPRPGSPLKPKTC